MYPSIKKATSEMAFAGALLICAGFIFSGFTPAPQSIGVMLIFFHPFFNGGIKEALRSFIRNKYALGLGVYYLLIVISGLYTEDFVQYNKLVIMQIPLLLIPFGLYKEEILNREKRDIIFFVFVVAVIFAGVLSFVNYILHFQTIQEEITHSKPIPIVTGINHIYYSIILAFSACIVQWALFIRKFQYRKNKKLAWVALIIIVFLLHTISARTGLLCFYTEISISILWLMMKKKRIFQGVVVTVGMSILAVVTLLFVPSVKNRLENTRLDLYKYNSGQDINHYSLSMRLAALKTAANVFKKNPVTGVGPADIQNEMYKEYKIEKSPLILENQKKPHNQFLYTLVSLGIIGGIVFCYIILMPFFTGIVFRNYLFLIFFAVCLAAFQVEYMLERQVGITFFCLFYIILSSTGISAADSSALKSGEQTSHENN
jgi:O-antigen ligase